MKRQKTHIQSHLLPDGIQLASPKNGSYHKRLAILWGRSPYHLSGWVCFTLHKKLKAHWVKESNLTLSSSGQDSPQGVCSLRSIEVTTNFAVKGYNKQWNQHWWRDGVPGLPMGAPLNTKHTHQIFNYFTKPRMRWYKRSTIHYPQIRAVSSRKMG